MVYNGPRRTFTVAVLQMILVAATIEIHPLVSLYRTGREPIQVILDYCPSSDRVDICSNSQKIENGYRWNHC